MNETNDSTEASSGKPRDLRSLNAEEVESILAEWGHKSYRVTQFLGWLYKKRACSIDEMSDLPQELRDQMSKSFFLKPLELAKEQRSRDGTVKFLWRLADGELIESVLIPASVGRDGNRSDRHTICV
ncbi:MAG: 23S rRNA (adenine(2503)-C(2))-methyltransferase RlmN, partial [Verrucomicrobia bacterium]